MTTDITLHSRWVGRKKHPWSEHVKMITNKLKKYTGLLKRLGVHSGGMDASISRIVAQTMTLSIAVSNAEVWQLQNDLQKPIKYSWTAYTR